MKPVRNVKVSLFQHQLSNRLAYSQAFFYFAFAHVCHKRELRVCSLQPENISF